MYPGSLLITSRRNANLVHTMMRRPPVPDEGQLARSSESMDPRQNERSESGLLVVGVEPGERGAKAVG
ncbi:MAG: hypothetical protein ACI88C_001606 [Acidimicrobiales bacterium]|jgi:hypothetical protein